MAAVPTLRTLDATVIPRCGHQRHVLRRRNLGYLSNLRCTVRRGPTASSHVRNSIAASCHALDTPSVYLRTASRLVGTALLHVGHWPDANTRSIDTTTRRGAVDAGRRKPHRERGDIGGTCSSVTTGPSTRIASPSPQDDHVRQTNETQWTEVQLQRHLGHAISSMWVRGLLALWYRVWVSACMCLRLTKWRALSSCSFRLCSDLYCTMHDSYYYPVSGSSPQLRQWRCARPPANATFAGHHFNFRMCCSSETVNHISAG